MNTIQALRVAHAKTQWNNWTTCDLCDVINRTIKYSNKYHLEYEYSNNLTFQAPFVPIYIICNSLPAFLQEMPARLQCPQAASSRQQITGWLCLLQSPFFRRGQYTQTWAWAWKLHPRQRVSYTRFCHWPADERCYRAKEWATSNRPGAVGGTPVKLVQGCRATWLGFSRWRLFKDWFNTILNSTLVIVIYALQKRWQWEWTRKSTFRSE